MDAKREALDKALAEAERADKEAEKAKTEAAIAKAVNDFLNNDLLGMADAGNQILGNLFSLDGNGPGNGDLLTQFLQ